MATVEYSVNNGIGTIALNRPEKRNAIDRELSDALDAAFAHMMESFRIEVRIMPEADG